MPNNSVRGNGNGNSENNTSAAREIASRQTKNLSEVRSDNKLAKQSAAAQKKAQRELSKLKIKDEQEAAKKYVEFYTKYMKALIAYEGIQRVEQFMFHKDAFREILLNAIVHKDYSSCNPIQISVYEDKIYIWNDGEMPPNLDSTDKLFMKHSSKFSCWLTSNSHYIPLLNV